MDWTIEEYAEFIHHLSAQERCERRYRELFGDDDSGSTVNAMKTR